MSAFIARAVYLDLRAHDYDVFMDVESIDSGTFDTIILNQITARQHFLIILTGGSLDRCNEPEDWLRREIEYAMDMERNIVPIMLNQFRFADYEDVLTGKLAELKRFNGLSLPHEYFDAAMERLRTRYLKLPMRGMLQPVPENEQDVVESKQEQADTLPPPTLDELTAEEYFERAYGYQINKDFKKAMADYDEAIRLNPQYARAYYNRGAARQAQGDLTDAMQDINMAIRLDPQAGYAYDSRGDVWYAQGDLRQALIDYTEAIRLAPQLAIPYKNRGTVYTDQDNLEAAIADYQKYLDLGGGSRYGDQVETEELIAKLKKQLE